MRKSLLYLTLISCLLVLFVDQADAGRLHVIRPVCEEYQAAAAVFTAYVTDVQRTDGKDIPTAGRSWLITVSMKIEEAFKGITESEIVFTQKWDFENCSPDFIKGELWLLYAIRDPRTDALHPMECGRSRKVEFAGSDLRYLRALPAIATQTRLSGDVGQYAQGPGNLSRHHKPLAGVKVTVTHQQGQSYEGITDRDGGFEFIGLPSGKYTIQADIPKPLQLLDSARNGVEVTLRERGCAEASIRATSIGSVSGKVIHEDGEIVADLKVTLLPVERAGDHIQFQDTLYKFTDAEGKFAFNELPPGNYVIGVNLDSQPSGRAPFPRTFYPGVPALPQAEILVLAEGETLPSLILRLPQAMATRVIEGRAFFSDGQVVTQGQISFADSDQPKGYLVYASGLVGKDGRFSLRVLQGAAGWLHAYGSEHPKALGSGLISIRPDKLHVTEDIKHLKIIIPLPDGQ